MKYFEARFFQDLLKVYYGDKYAKIYVQYSFGYSKEEGIYRLITAAALAEKKGYPPHLYKIPEYVLQDIVSGDTTALLVYLEDEDKKKKDK